MNQRTAPSGPVNELLDSLARLSLRGITSPLPRHPAAFGWQMQAAGTAALAVRLLDALHRLDPQEAERVADFARGPLGEGPNLGNECYWQADQLAPRIGADPHEWLQEAIAAAEATAS